MTTTNPSEIVRRIKQSIGSEQQMEVPKHPWLILGDVVTHPYNLVSPREMKAYHPDLTTSETEAAIEWLTRTGTCKFYFAPDDVSDSEPDIYLGLTEQGIEQLQFGHVDLDELRETFDRLGDALPEDVESARLAPRPSTETIGEFQIPTTHGTS